MELITMYTGQMQTMMEIKGKLSYSNAVLHKVLKRLDVIERVVRFEQQILQQSYPSGCPSSLLKRFMRWKAS